LLAGLTETVVVLLRSSLPVGTVMSMSMAAMIQFPTVQLAWWWSVVAPVAWAKARPARVREREK